MALMVIYKLIDILYILLKVFKLTIFKNTDIVVANNWLGYINYLT